MITTLLRGRPVAIAVVCLATGLPAAAATVTVTPATLHAAFLAAKSGDTLKLVGAFPGETLTDRTFDKGLTIDATAATFTTKFELDNVSNVTFRGGTFNLAGDPLYTKGIVVNGGKNVYVDRVVINGSGLQFGVSFLGTGNAQVTNGVYTGLSAAILLGSVSSGVVGHNTILKAQTDGIDIANSHSITASYNSCSAGLPGQGVHPDCIQLWSVSGNPLQSDITVTNNQATGPTQGFTSFADGGGGLRLKLLSNVANTSYPQGVACYGCINSVIANNRVSTIPGSTYQTEVNVVAGSGNSVFGNLVTAYQPPRGTAATIDDGFDDADTPHSELTSLIMAYGGGSAAAAVPEPSTWLLLVAGFAAVGVIRRRAVARITGRGARCMA